MGETLRSVFRQLLLDTGLEAHLVDLLLKQTNWREMRPCVVALLKKIVEAFARRLQEEGYSPREGYRRPLEWFASLAKTVAARVPPGTATAEASTSRSTSASGSTSGSETHSCGSGSGDSDGRESVCFVPVSLASRPHA